MTKPEIEVHTVPMMDTGIGREAGFRDDAELVAVAEAERQAMSQDQRDLLDKIDAEVERRMLFGDG